MSIMSLHQHDLFCVLDRYKTARFTVNVSRYYAKLVLRPYKSLYVFKV